MVIDQDTDFLGKVERWLAATDAAIECVTFTAAIEAVEYLRRSSADLVVTAYLMPQIDGLQLIDLVRTFKPELPMLMTSTVPLKEAALARGATGYCTKRSLWSLLETEIAKRLNPRAVAA